MEKKNNNNNEVKKKRKLEESKPATSGSTSAPSLGAFGATRAPVGFGGFGATPAPAPGGATRPPVGFGGFGATPATGFHCKFQSKGRAKTAMGVPLKALSESAAGLLKSTYKVEDEMILSTTTLAM